MQMYSNSEMTMKTKHKEQKNKLKTFSSREI